MKRLMTSIAAFLWHVTVASAQVFNGGGIDAGLGAAAGVTGVSSSEPRTVVVNLLKTVLNYAALAATVMVVIAGFYLVLSLGNDDQKEKAKKIIQYTLIGLLVLLFSRFIVSLITVWLPTQI